MAEADALIDKIPKYHQLIFPVLKALKALGGSGTNEEIAEKVCELENFSEEMQNARSRFSSSQTALNYQLAWAKTYLKRVGAVTNTEKGVHSLTEKGAALTQQDCDMIPAEVRKQTSERKKKKGKEERPQEDELSETEAGASWRDALLSILTKIKPDAFERLAQRILREAGFIKVEVTGKSGDGGIDGMGILRVNLISFTVLFQCKRYQGSVGAGAIRDFRGAMQGRCDKGLVITTGTFSSDARREATRDGAPAIDLIDGETLCDLLKSLKLGVGVTLVEEVAIQSDFFSTL